MRDVQQFRRLDLICEIRDLISKSCRTVVDVGSPEYELLCCTYDHVPTEFFPTEFFRMFKRR